MKRLSSIIAAGMVALAALPALAQQNGGGTAPNPGYGYYHHMWHGGMFFHPLLSLLLIAAIIAIVARLFGWRRYGRYRYGGYRSGGALDILEERFARGEIDKGEFEERRKLLMR